MAGSGLATRADALNIARPAAWLSGGDAVKLAYYRQKFLPSLIEGHLLTPEQAKEFSPDLEYPLPIVGTYSFVRLFSIEQPDLTYETLQDYVRAAFSLEIITEFQGIDILDAFERAEWGQSDQPTERPEQPGDRHQTEADAASQAQVFKESVAKARAKLRAAGRRDSRPEVVKALWPRPDTRSVSTLARLLKKHGLTWDDTK